MNGEGFAFFYFHRRMRGSVFCSRGFGCRQCRVEWARRHRVS